MSGPDDRVCGVCGQDGGQKVGGVNLCADHAAIARRLENLKAAQTDSTVDLIGRRSQGPRDDHSGGYKRPFDVVPPDSVEQVRRDVKVTFHNLPIWGVEPLFQRVHKELGQPNVDGWGATLYIEYSGLEDLEYARLLDFQESLWTEVEIDLTKVRIHPPLKQAAKE